MKEIFFYNITSRDFFKDSAILIEKLFKQGIKVLILCPDDEVTSFFDDFLWSFKEESFIPHTVLDRDSSQLETIIISKKQLSIESFKTLMRVSAFFTPLARAKEITKIKRHVKRFTTETGVSCIVKRV